MEIIYKARQEEILFNNLLASGLTSREILNDIKKFYDRNPYHNFLHALKVAQGILSLSLENNSIVEIKSLFYAALFHDALHTGTARILDEFYSLTLARKKIELYEKQYNLQGIDYGILRKGIIGTVFKNRGALTNKHSTILADVDIAIIGEDLHTFMFYAIPLAIEFGDDVENFFLKTNVGYFKYLMGINPNVIINEEVRLLFPNSLKVIKHFVSLDLNLQKEIFEYLISNDITLDEFKNKYSNI